MTTATNIPSLSDLFAQVGKRLEAKTLPDIDLERGVSKITIKVGRNNTREVEDITRDLHQVLTVQNQRLVKAFHTAAQPYQDRSNSHVKPHGPLPEVTEEDYRRLEANEDITNLTGTGTVRDPYILPDNSFYTIIKTWDQLTKDRSYDFGSKEKIHFLPKNGNYVFEVLPYGLKYQGGTVILDTIAYESWLHH